MVCCALCGHEQTDSVNLFKFPLQNLGLCSAWLAALKLSKTTSSSSICQNHFRREDLYESYIGLFPKKGAIPVNRARKNQRDVLNDQSVTSSRESNNTVSSTVNIRENPRRVSQKGQTVPAAARYGDNFTTQETDTEYVLPVDYSRTRSRSLRRMQVEADYFIKDSLDCSYVGGRSLRNRDTLHFRDFLRYTSVPPKSRKNLRSRSKSKKAKRSRSCVGPKSRARSTSSTRSYVIIDRARSESPAQRHQHRPTPGLPRKRSGSPPGMNHHKKIIKMTKEGVMNTVPPLVISISGAIRRSRSVTRKPGNNNAGASFNNPLPPLPEVQMVPQNSDMNSTSRFHSFLAILGLRQQQSSTASTSHVRPTVLQTRQTRKTHRQEVMMTDPEYRLNMLQTLASIPLMIASKEKKKECFIETRDCMKLRRALFTDQELAKAEKLCSL